MKARSNIENKMMKTKILFNSIIWYPMLEKSTNWYQKFIFITNFRSQFVNGPFSYVFSITDTIILTINWIFIVVTARWRPVQALKTKWWKPKYFLIPSFVTQYLKSPQIDIKSLYLLPTFGLNLWTGRSVMFLV